MFAIWWLTAVWFFTWVINYGKVRNWFREVCHVGHAGYVHVWAPAEVKILTANASPLVWLVRKAKVLWSLLLFFPWQRPSLFCLAAGLCHSAGPML